MGRMQSQSLLRRSGLHSCWHRLRHLTGWPARQKTRRAAAPARASGHPPAHKQCSTQAGCACLHGSHQQSMCPMAACTHAHQAKCLRKGVAGTSWVRSAGSTLIWSMTCGVYAHRLSCIVYRVVVCSLGGVLHAHENACVRHTPQSVHRPHELRRARQRCLPGPQASNAAACFVWCQGARTPAAPKSSAGKAPGRRARARTPAAAKLHCYRLWTCQRSESMPWQDGAQQLPCS